MRRDQDITLQILTNYDLRLCPRSFYEIYRLATVYEFLAKFWLTFVAKSGLVTVKPSYGYVAPPIYEIYLIKKMFLPHCSFYLFITC